MKVVICIAFLAVLALSEGRPSSPLASSTYKRQRYPVPTEYLKAIRPTTKNSANTFNYRPVSDSSDTQTHYQPYAPQSYTPQRYTPQRYTPQRYTPQRYTPKTYTPQTYTPQTYTPQRYTPQRYTPQRYTPQRYTPQRYTPQRYTPQRYTPQRYTPQRYTPQRYTPQRYTPQTYTPQTYTPQTYTPQTYTPQTYTPQTYTPQTYTPQTYTPQTYTPQRYAPKPYYRTPALSYYNSEEGESAQNWDVSGGSQYDNQQIQDGYGRGQITSDSSGYESNRGDDIRSNRKHGNSASVDQYGNQLNNQYASNTASADKNDDISGYAKTRGEIYTPDDYQVYDKGSNFGDFNSDKTRSADNADYTNNLYADGTFVNSNLHDVSASDDKTADRNNAAYDKGQISRDGGRDEETYDLGSNAISHKGSGGASFNNAFDAVVGDPHNVQSTSQHKIGADDYQQDDRSDERHHNHALSADYGKDHQELALSSLDRSQDDSNAQSLSIDQDDRQAGDDGSVHSAQRSYDGRSQNAISAQDADAKADESISQNYGDKTEATSAHSNARAAKVDNAASNHDVGSAAGQDQSGIYSVNHDNSGNSALKTDSNSSTNKLQGQITANGGATQDIYSVGDNSHGSKGSATSSNKKKSGGQFEGPNDSTYRYPALNL